MGIRKPPVMKPYNPKRKGMSRDEAMAEDAAHREARIEADKLYEAKMKERLGEKYNPQSDQATNELEARKQLVATRLKAVKKLESDYKDDPQDKDLKEELVLARKKLVEAEGMVKKQEELISKLS